jgi:protein SCO1
MSTDPSVPSHLVFRDDNGREIRLSDYLGQRPVILAPVYYRCPNLCGSTLADLAFVLRRVSLTAGRDYEIIAVSIDPREQPADAATAKSWAMVGEGSAELPSAAHFLTGSPGWPIASCCCATTTIRRLAVTRVLSTDG